MAHWKADDPLVRAREPAQKRNDARSSALRMVCEMRNAAQAYADNENVHDEAAGADMRAAVRRQHWVLRVVDANERIQQAVDEDQELG